MAGVNMDVYEFDSVVRGHHIHVYATAWTSLIDEMLQVVREDTNKCDEYVVAIAKRGCFIEYIGTN